MFHMAAPNSSINNYQLHHSVNVGGRKPSTDSFFNYVFFFFFSKNKFYDVVQILFEGTKNVIDACIEQKVKILIYTSSPSVVFDGVHGILNGDESLPYPPMVLKPESPFSIFINFCVTFFFIKSFRLVQISVYIVNKSVQVKLEVISQSSFVEI